MSSRWLRGRIACWILASATVSGVALAEPAKPAAAAPTKRLSPEDEARARFNEGIALADVGDHEAARLKFNQAWALLKSPVVLYNLALSEQLSGHPVDALEHYQLFDKASADPKVTEAQRKRASENVTALARELGQIQIEAPPGARVTVDGRMVTSTEDLVFVTPGRHDVEAVVDGKPRTIAVECGAGVVTKAKLVERAPAPPAAEPVVPTAEARPHDPAFWSTGRVLGASAVGVGLVGVGLGIAFHLEAANTRDDAEVIHGRFPADQRNTLCSTSPSDPRCNELRTTVDDQHSQENLRTAFFIGGGALVLGGAALFVVSSPKDAETGRKGTRIVPTTSTRYLGLTMSGQF